MFRFAESRIQFSEDLKTDAKNVGCKIIYKFAEASI